MVVVTLVLVVVVVVMIHDDVGNLGNRQRSPIYLLHISLHVCMKLYHLFFFRFFLSVRVSERRESAREKMGHDFFRTLFFLILSLSLSEPQHPSYTMEGSTSSLPLNQQNIASAVLSLSLFPR